jgi:hypothetical protein
MFPLVFVRIRIQRGFNRDPSPGFSETRLTPVLQFFSSNKYLITLVQDENADIYLEKTTLVYSANF